MKKSIYVLGFAFWCSLFLLSCSKEEISTSLNSDNVVATQRKDVPLNGTFNLATIGFGTQCEPDAINPIIEGIGSLSHLGNTQFHANHCLIPTPTGEPAFVYDGLGVLTAANGDELHFSYTGVLNDVFNSNIFLRANWNFTINGGTGRFTDATGFGRLNLEYSDLVFPPGGGNPTFKIIGKLSGKISY